MDDPLRPSRQAMLAELRAQGRNGIDDSVILRPENEVIGQVFLMTRNQVVTIGERCQPIALSIPAVKVAMDLLGVQDQRTCLERTMKLFHHFESERLAKENTPHG